METNTSVKTARIKVLEDAANNPDSATLYKVNFKRKVRNILVNCDYFENKGVKSPKNITFSVSIKVYSVKRSNNPIWYELYGNTLDPKYNHMIRITSDYEIPLREGDRSYGTFKGIMEVIGGEFDDATKKFIDCTMKLIKNQGKITKTPQFILDAIEESRSAIDENTDERVIN